MAIADNGDIVGYSGARAVLWSANGTNRIIDVCTAIGWEGEDIDCASSANAINSAGQIAGNSDIDGASIVFRLTVGANRQDIPNIPGSYMSYAHAINEAGQVVGSSYGGPWQLGHAFRWSPMGGTIDLGAPPGRQWSRATSINNRGQVVGSSY